MSVWHVLSVLAALAFVAGLVLIVLGLRGRRIDDHPLCRRCRFDLTGMPPMSTRCPECGADLAAPRATVVGHRRKRVAFVLAGVALCLATLAPSGVWVGIVVRDPDWRTRMPLWYELAEARGTLPKDRALAIDELLRRDAAGQMDDAARARVAEAILRCQADPSLPWSNAWGDWFCAAIKSDGLPAALQERFATNGLREWKFEVRPRVRQGDVLGMRCTMTTPRARLGRFLDVRVTDMNRQLWIDDKPVNGDIDVFGTAPLSLFQSEMTADCPRLAALETLAQGRHTLEWRVHLIVTASGSPRASPPVGQAERAVADVTLVNRFPLDILPRDAHDIVHTKDPTMRASLTSAIGPVRFVTAKRPGPWIILSIDFTATLPRTVAFEAIVRQNGKEFPIARFVRRAGVAADTLVLRADLLTGDPPRPGTADLILRPSDDAATRTVDVTDLWDDGDVVIQNVEVE